MLSPAVCLSLPYPINSLWKSPCSLHLHCHLMYSDYYFLSYNLSNYLLIKIVVLNLAEWVFFFNTKQITSCYYLKILQGLSNLETSFDLFLCLSGDHLTWAPISHFTLYLLVFIHQNVQSQILEMFFSLISNSLSPLFF